MIKWSVDKVIRWSTNQLINWSDQSDNGSQGLEVSCELCEEILAVGAAGEAGQALLDEHVGGLDKGKAWLVFVLKQSKAKSEFDQFTGIHYDNENQ